MAQPYEREGRNPPQKRFKQKGECGLCGKETPKLDMQMQRGVLVCARCVDDPGYKGQLSRGPNWQNSGV